MCDWRLSRERNFEYGQTVIVRDYRKSNKWEPAKILNRTWPVSYCVETSSGSNFRRHADPILDSKLTNTSDYIITPYVILNNDDSKDKDSKPPYVPPTPIQTKSTDSEIKEKRYPQRSRKPPTKYKHFVVN